LVDDHGTAHLDAELAMLNGLPNMEVRLFNPFTLRKPRLACYLFNFARLNRRMHNKSFSVDGATAILGGRNIGDVYFARDAEVQYFDFDLFAAGPVVAAVAEDFDAYWNCRSAYPHELLAAPTPGTDQVFDAEVKAANEGDDAQVYLDELNSTDVVNKLTSGTLSLDWVPVTLHSDRPIKGLRHLRSSKLLAAELTLILVKARTNVDIACAYFVPGRRGAKLLVSMARAGRTARILTNSLEATNVLPVHASYLKYRKRLLKGGVKLFEMKSSQSNDNRSFLGILGKSAACLHAKIFMMDNDKVFVGSFNFDPRSVFLNCEMGFLVESSQLSDLLMATFNRSLSQAAWAVNLRKDGELNWIGTDEEGNAVVRRDEPGSTSKRRLAMAVISRLPIEWLM
jgi:putative cardiolipin synthase